MSQPRTFTNTFTLSFMIVLSVVCALILSALASALKNPQEEAREIYRSKQMLVAAQVYNLDGHYFQMKNEEGKYVPAKYETGGVLVPGTTQDIATQDQILDIYRRRIRPFLVDKEGKLTTFQDADINEMTYTHEFKKRGYYLQPEKLIYEILANPKSANDADAEIEGYIIPVNGYGLWDAIYGYLAIAPDGITVIGISWYEQKETPGLGANISESPWQSLFPGKKIFQMAANPADTNLKLAPIGITVVRGKVSEVYGDSPKAESAVDGMAGATLTGNGVTSAYKDVLEAYRPFLITVNEKYKSENKAKT